MAEDSGQMFLKIVDSACQLPGVKISRDKFLADQFSGPKYRDKLTQILEYGPVAAGIPKDEIEKMAKGCINFETVKVTAISTAAGIPGGVAMAATIPADAVQFYGHVFRVIQKLMYLYGFEDLSGMNENAKAIMIVFLGVMCGVQGVTAAAAQLCKTAAASATKKIAAKALTKGTIYPIVKKVAATLGVKMTKDVFAKGVGKAIPVIGGVFSGGLTLATFKPMAHKLQKFLQSEIC